MKETEEMGGFYAFRRRRRSVSVHTVLIAIGVLTGVSSLMLAVRSVDHPSDAGFLPKLDEEEGSQGSSSNPPNGAVQSRMIPSERSSSKSSCPTVPEVDESFIQEHFPLNGFKILNHGGYTIEVTGLSPKAVEKNVYDFFAFSGVIEHVEIVRSGEFGRTAYVTFKDAHAQQTAVLLSGATILDQRVCIARWGHHEDERDLANRPSLRVKDETESTTPRRDQFVHNAGAAVTMAQEMVKRMLAKGYMLGKDALSKAKAFDESHQVSATAATNVATLREQSHRVSTTAAAKVTELSERIGLPDKIIAGMEAVKAVDQRYHVSEMAKSAISTTANTVVNSSYFSKGALWLSDVLHRAAEVVADLGNQGVQH